MLSFGVTVLPDPPYQRFLELIKLAESHGFDHGWTYDSHILWHDAYPLLTLAAAETKSMMLGHCVTNPGIREPTVTASAYATLQQISNGRMVMGIGRGDSSMRVVGLPPVRVEEFETSLPMIKDLMNGRRVEWRDREQQLEWATGQPEIPMYVAGYGPRALKVAGRYGDGIIIQLAEPELIDWIMGLARKAADEAGRDPDVLKPIVCTPVYVSEDLDKARAQVKWFPAMVGNHVADLLRHHDPDTLPQALWDYIKRRDRYDYHDHSRVGAKHGEFVDDETADSFTILGPVEAHVEKLRRLEEIGVAQLNIYLMTDAQEQTLEIYGRDIIPQFTQVAA
jgi:probable F420-dependent oxidoreductase